MTTYIFYIKMYSQNGFFNSMAKKHIAKQLTSCCCFMIDKRYLFEAIVFVFFILPICAFQWTIKKNLHNNYFDAKPSV